MFADADRPRAPQHPDAPSTAVGREGRGFLLAVHGHLRAELGQVVHAVRLAAADIARAPAARALVNDLTRGLDPAAVGSYCRRWCRVVETHHRIEDAALFPDLAQADGGLRPVLTRLSVEHELLHEVLVRLDDLLVDLGTGGLQDSGELTTVLADLEQGLLSHLDYEERELLDAIERLAVRV